MEELIELLEEIQPDADFENCDTLIVIFSPFT